MPRPEHRLPRQAAAIPAAVFLILAGAFALLWFHAEGQEERNLGERTQDTANQSAQLLEEHVAARLSVADQVRHAWQAGAIRDEQQYRAVARVLIERHAEVQAINWIDPQGVIRWVEPPEATQAAEGQSLEQNERAQGAFIKARRTGELTVTPPLDLYQGGFGFAAYLALGEPEKDGFVNIVFRYPALIEGCLERGVTARFQYAVESEGQTIHASSSSDEIPTSRFRQEVRFPVGDRSWKLLLAPDATTLAAALGVLDEWFLGAGIALAAVLALLTRRFFIDQASLARKEARYRRVVEDLPDLLCRYQPDGTITFVNEAFAQYHGQGVQDLTGSSLFELYPVERREKLLEQIANVRTSGQATTSERETLSVTGAVRWQQWRERALTDGADQTIEIQSIGHDSTERRQAEEKLKESEQRYRSLVETSPDAIIIHHQGKVLYSNAALAKLLGADDACGLVGQPVLNLVHPEDREGVAKNIREITESASGPRSMEARFLHRDGTKIEVGVIGTRIIFDGLTCVQAIVRDITESKRAESALRESEERFRTIFGVISDAVLILDRRGGVIEANSRAETLFGYPGEILARMDVGALGVDEPPITHDRLLSLIAGFGEGSSQLFEWRARHASGSRWWAEVHLRCALVAGRERVLAVVRDITERKRVHEALAEARNRLDHLLSTSPTVIYSRTPAPDATITFVSRNVSQLTGIEAGSFVGSRHPHLDLLHPRDRSRFEREAARADRDAKTFNCEYRIRTAEGDSLWIQDDAKLIRDRRGLAIEWVGTWRDVSERKRAERRQRMIMDELDHRVKNTLAMVLSLMDQTMATSASMPGFRRAFTGRVQALARTHDALARELWQCVTLEAVVHLVLAPHAPPGSQRLVTRGGSEVLESRMASPLGLALHELATNAVKYGALSARGGHVEISWEGTADAILLRWRECGGPPVTPPTGRGIGLDLVHGLVEHELGGQVELRFEPEGLECELRIPVHEPTHERDAADVALP